MYVCLSTDKGNQYIFPAANCGQSPTGGIVQNLGPASFNWATSQPPAGSTTLYLEYGTTSPGNYNSGTEFWYPAGNGPSSAELPYVTPGAPSVVTWVFSSAAAAGPGSTHVCEALVNQTFMGQQTSYYQLFSYAQRSSGCVRDFWT